MNVVKPSFVASRKNPLRGRLWCRKESDMTPWNFMRDLCRQVQNAVGMQLTLRCADQSAVTPRVILNAGVRDIGQNKRELWVILNSRDLGTVDTSLLCIPGRGAAVLHFHTEASGHEWLSCFRDWHVFGCGRQLPTIARHCRPEALAEDVPTVQATQGKPEALLVLEAGNGKHFRRRGYAVSSVIVPMSELEWAISEFRYQFPCVANSVPQVLVFNSLNVRRQSAVPLDAEFWVYVDGVPRTVTPYEARELFRSGLIEMVSPKSGNGEWLTMRQANLV